MLRANGNGHILLQLQLAMIQTFCLFVFAVDSTKPMNRIASHQHQFLLILMLHGIEFVYTIQYTVQFVYFFVAIVIGFFWEIGSQTASFISHHLANIRIRLENIRLFGEGHL